MASGLHCAFLPNSGDLAACSNWQGIMRLSVPAKLFARVIASRLQDYAEGHGLLPEWQCGFRAGRSTIDMIFTIRMILERANHRKVPLFLLLVDLIKAYDSVSRQGLWNALKAKGVPPDLMHLIRRHYSHKTARVAAGATSPSTPFTKLGRSRNSGTLMVWPTTLASLSHHTGPLEGLPTSDPPVVFVAFRYLGSHIDWQFTCTPEITYRLDQARKSFWKLASSVWDVRQLSLATELRVYRACVLSVLLYACETWTVWFRMRLRLEALSP